MKKCSKLKYKNNFVHFRSHKGKDRGDKFKDSFSEGLKHDDKSSSESE